MEERGMEEEEWRKGGERGREEEEGRAVTSGSHALSCLPVSGTGNARDARTRFRGSRQP